MSGNTGQSDLPRDMRLERAWRAASTETPPGSLDARILEAARAEASPGDAAESRGGKAARFRWTPLAAAAGVAGLAFAVLQWLPRDDASSPRPASREALQRPETADESRVPSAPPPEPARASDPAARVLQPQTAPTVLSNGADAVSEETTTPRAESAATPGTESSPDPGAWARRIDELYGADNLPAALAEIRRFREAHPDADSYLPPEIRSWAAAIDAGPDIPSPER